MEFLNVWWDSVKKAQGRGYDRVMRIKGDKESLRRLASLLTNGSEYGGERWLEFKNSPKFGIGPRDYRVVVECVEDESKS